MEVDYVRDPRDLLLGHEPRRWELMDVREESLVVGVVVGDGRELIV